MKVLLCLALAFSALQAAGVSSGILPLPSTKLSKGQPSKTPVIKNIPDDIKASEAFFKHSKEQYQDLQKESALRLLKMRMASQNLDLEVPHLEMPLLAAGLKPVAKLVKAKSEDGAPSRKLEGMGLWPVWLLKRRIYISVSEYLPGGCSLSQFCREIQPNVVFCRTKGSCR